MTNKKFEINFGTNKEADKAALELQEEFSCAGGCGRYQKELDNESWWCHFMSLNEEETCLSPRWICESCFNAEEKKEYNRRLLNVPEQNRNEVKILQENLNELYELWGTRLFFNNQDLENKMSEIISKLEELGWEFDKAVVDTDDKVSH